MGKNKLQVFIENLRLPRLIDEHGKVLCKFEHRNAEEELKIMQKEVPELSIHLCQYSFENEQNNEQK